MSNDARLYLVAYDIANPQRWRRVQKIIKAICRRSQLSVFVCRATPARISRLEKEMRCVLHERDDRLIVIDLGPAHGAAPQVKAMNPITDIAELGAAII
jgi:CRISPR-associated protein Cas2